MLSALFGYPTHFPRTKIEDPVVFANINSIPDVLSELREI
jgi:hypothetical protein